MQASDIVSPCRKKNMNTQDKAVTDSRTVASEVRDDYKSPQGIASWWQKDGAWHIALPCTDPDPKTGLRTGGYRWTTSQYDSRDNAIRAIKALS